ncbi:hypothetical protein ACFOW4_12690 [Micromonospora sp. GCM10011542]|uniref:hypothetical protein n=1 Tax=Micromonospora sp. GCM10011542 TaxID=3317337 RepID=UPI00361B5A25
MNKGTRIGLAVGFGYLLGRRRKLRTALTLAAAVAAGRASRHPGGLLKRGTDVLHSSPHLNNLSKLGGPLVNAGKAAATAAAGSRVDALSGKLRDSADALRHRSGGGDQSGNGGGGDSDRGLSGGDRDDSAGQADRGDTAEQRQGR